MDTLLSLAATRDCLKRATTIPYRSNLVGCITAQDWPRVAHGSQGTQIAMSYKCPAESLQIWRNYDIALRARRAD